MGFRLFGVNVEVQLGFWLMSFFLGMSAQYGPAIVVWMLVVFVSVLVHEYGHALAVKRHGIEPEISLHWMGGTTTWREVIPVSRGSRIVISLAGPFAGFAFGGLVFVGAWAAGRAGILLPELAELAIANLLWVNVGWGLVNLAPVLPFDGGHVLEHALGPRRERLTGAISFFTALAILVYALSGRQLWMAMLFGSAAFASFQRWRGSITPPRIVDSRSPAAPRPDRFVDGPTAAALRRARQALADDAPAEALRIAQGVLAGADGNVPTPRAAHEALVVAGWAHFLEGRLDEASAAIARARKIDEPDPALVGAVLLARGDRREARRVLEQARAAGDDRKEVVGPLVQALLEDGETARAAAIALDVVDSLSEDDARKMASIAFDARAFTWAARLYQAVFEREGAPDDAYEAARAFSLAGEQDRALDLLRRAVKAGFSDRARAWSDAALEALRGDHLDAVLPRP